MNGNNVISDITHENWLDRQKRIKLDTGIEMAYIEAGNPDGKPLIFIHGFTDSGRCWLACFPHFQKEYHIFSIDMRGCGSSDKPEQFAYPIVQLGADLVSFIDKLELDGVFLAGHSMGSMVAYTVGFMIPDKISGIALVSTGARMHETPEMVKELKAENEAMGERELTIEEMHPGHADYPDQDNLKYYMKTLKGLKSSYFKTAWWGMSLSDQRNFLQFIKAPVLIIWGRYDELFTKEYQDEMLRLLPKAKFITYDNTHEIPSETPDKMSEDINSFFSGIK